MAEDAELEAKLARLDATIAAASEDLDARLELARAREQRALILGRLRRFDEADAAFAQLSTDFGDDDDSDVALVVARGRYNRLVFRRNRGSHADTLAAAEEFLALYLDDPPRRGLDLVVSALKLKGFVLWKLARVDEAIETYDQALARYGDEDDAVARADLVAMLVQEAELARDAGRLQLALHTCEEVIGRFGDVDDPDVQAKVASATFSKAVVLRALDRAPDAIAVWHGLWECFQYDPSPPFPSVAVDARYNEARCLWELGLADQARAACDEIIARHRPDDHPRVDQAVANAIGLRLMLIESEQQAADALAALDRLLAVVSGASAPPLRLATVQILLPKLWWLLEQARVADAIAVTADLLARFAAETDPAAVYETADQLRKCPRLLLYHPRFRRLRRKPAFRVAMRIADAVNGSPRPDELVAAPGTGQLASAIALTRACRGQAGKIYDVLIERFADADEPRLRALALRCEIERSTALVEALHARSGVAGLSRTWELGRPAADVYGELAAELDEESSGAARAAMFKLMRATALSNSAQVEDEKRVYSELIERHRGDHRLVARLIVLNARLWRALS